MRIQKVWYKCNKCGSAVEVHEAPFPTGEMPPGWVHVKGDVHLCETCAEEYRDVESRAARMLAEALGEKPVTTGL